MIRGTQSYILINGVPVPIIVTNIHSNVIHLLNPDGTSVSMVVLEQPIEYHDPYPEPSE
jgi:hypothetical protein